MILLQFKGYAAGEIRKAFLDFFLSILKTYRDYFDETEFRSMEFVANMSFPDDEGQFVLSLTATQMFEGFLADRRECPDDSEVLFFDESIDAKSNKSKKSRLTGGRIETPFLSNNELNVSAFGAVIIIRVLTYWCFLPQVAETFIPPPPSNWGLPDDERTYHYGTFPKLHRELFGKVREPKQLIDDERNPPTRRLRRRLTLAARENEQVVAKKAALSLVPKGSKHATLKALSSPFARWTGSDNLSGGRPDSNSDKSSSDVSLPSTFPVSPEFRSSKEKLALNTRRRQAILIGAVVKLQSICRMYIVRRRRYGKLISYGSRSNLSLKDRAAVMIQSVTRMHRDRTAFKTIGDLVAKVQAISRGYHVRFVLHRALARRLELYRTVIFDLWDMSFTPLSYRSTLWGHMSSISVLRLALAEEELHRLWEIFGLDLPGAGRALPWQDEYLALQNATVHKSLEVRKI